MTLEEEISSAAKDIADKPKEKRRRSFLGLFGARKHLIWEFLKWLLFFLGVTGILANDRFVSWMRNINAPLGNLFSTKILEIPIAIFLFIGTILLASILSTLQKRDEIVSRERIDEVATLVSELAMDLGKGTRTVYVGGTVLNQLGEVRNTLLKLSIDLEKLKKKQLTQKESNLKEIPGIGPKNLQKLKDIGIIKITDLLKEAPEDVAIKTGISPKIIARWFEYATKESGPQTIIS